MSNLQSSIWKIKQFSLISGHPQDAWTPIWLKVWWLVSSRFANMSHVFCFTTDQGSLYQQLSLDLADGSFHIVASMYVGFGKFRKNSDAVCGFLPYFCAVLQFSDHLFAPLSMWFSYCSSCSCVTTWFFYLLKTYICFNISININID